jgi:hypothetical protein
MRLFAEHRLAEREGGFGNGAVGGLRRGDDHRLDLRVGNDQLLPVAAARAEAVSGAIAFGRIGFEPAETISSRGRRPVSNTAPTADMATACALPM